MERKRLVMIWVGAAIVVAYCVYTLGAINGERSKKPSPFGPVASEATPTASLTVQVTGRVNAPGVYVLPSNARVQDALQKAGGTAPDADVSTLNLAGWLQDGARIEVPARMAAAPNPVLAPNPAVAPNPVVPLPPTPAPIIIRNVPAPTVPIVTSPSPFPGASVTSPASAPTQAAPNDAVNEFLRKNPVNLNTANAAQLELLPEIGPKMAARILEHRAANGPFRSTEDLRQIKGFGDKTMASISPFIFVR